jgi:ribonuclease HI
VKPRCEGEKRLGMNSDRKQTVVGSVKEMKCVTIYTDGGCINNPGPGGYAAILLFGDHRKEISGGFRLTTNNRMELYAAIVGITALKERCRVTVYSDSQYLVNAMEKGWVLKWRSQQWWRNKKRGARALNPDLWERLLQVCESHQIDFRWLRGHAGSAENERCDELAKAAAQGPDLAIDAAYEQNNPV